jgi:hypothetical protein
MINMMNKTLESGFIRVRYASLMFGGLLRVRGSRREETAIIHGNLLVAGKLVWDIAPISFGNRARVLQSRIKATTYVRALHYPLPKNFVAPTAFALERLTLRD